jgi:hypothetical protein
MRSALILVAFATVSCKAHSQQTKAALPTFDACVVAKAHLTAMSCKPAQLLVSAIDQLAGTDEPTRRKSDLDCAWMLDRSAANFHEPGCTLSLTPDERAAVTARLAERAKAEPTGDAESDKILRAVAKIRDEACACTTDACFDGLDDKLAAAGSLSDRAPDRARVLATEMVDDISGCQTRYRDLH